MPYSLNQRKTSEGCGKWLTTKGKSNPKSCVKPSINQNIRKKTKLCFPETNANSYITRPPDIQYKLSNMKQSKINKFLINKSSQCSSSVKHSSKVKIPISFPMKTSGMAKDLNESEDLWGSESEDEEDGNCEMLFNSQMSSKIGFPPPTATTSRSTASCNIAKNMSLDIRINKKDDVRQDEVFFSPKKLKKAEGDPASIMSDTCFTPKCNTSRNEFPFTQWFQGQVDEFCKYSSEKKSDLMKDILSSVPYCYLSSPKSKQSSFKQESPLMVQFSEWFNQQVEIFSSQSSSFKDNESLENSTACSPSKISKQSFAFTQWFEENFEKCLKS